MADHEKNHSQHNDDPLGVPGVPPSEYHPHRPDAPFKKKGNVRKAILLAIAIVIIDICIYYFLIRPDDAELLKAIEPLKPKDIVPTQTVANPTPPPDVMPSVAAGNLQAVTKLAKEDLAKRLQITVAEIKTISEEPVTWNDGSLGCPQPDMMYTQALVEGSKVVLSAQNKSYDYHAGTQGTPFLCEKQEN